MLLFCVAMPCVWNCIAIRAECVCPVLAVSWPCASRAPCLRRVFVFAVLLPCVSKLFAVLLTCLTAHSIPCCCLRRSSVVRSPSSHNLSRCACRVCVPARVFCSATPRLPITGRAALSRMDLLRQKCSGQPLRGTSGDAATPHPATWQGLLSPNSPAGRFAW